MKSLILNPKDNSISEVEQTELQLEKSMNEYVLSNTQRLQDMDEYKAYEQSQRGYLVCSQLEALAKKGKAEFETSMNQAKRNLDRITTGEVERYSFVDDVKQSFKTRFGRMAIGLMVMAAILFLANMGFKYDAAVASADTGTVASQVVVTDTLGK